jgi:hypothetical protein
MASVANAGLTMPSIFGDNMVQQTNAEYGAVSGAVKAPSCHLAVFVSTADVVSSIRALNPVCLDGCVI